MDTETRTIDRNEAIRRIREALKRRSGRTWSVTGGRGTAWGWITITAPPARRGEMWDSRAPAPDPEHRNYMTVPDRAILASLLGIEGLAHPQGEHVPASTAHRREYVTRAETGAASEVAGPYWD